MRTEEVKNLLQRYFDGESTDADERMLEAYFQSGEVAEEVAEYAEFFGGISELAHIADDPTIEEDVMDYILENEHREKTRYRSMWKVVTGIAASVIIVLGGFLFYQEQQKSFKDTFQDPDEAYAYATKTLEFVSGKYSKGLAQLSNFDMLHKASDPIKKGTEPVVEFYDELNKIEKH
ncbi:hypothetical protein INQ51_12340 [Maribellus sp. CM-23]|uniref:anti-sigma factor family protein n=1 Tax=Maribellus sp. CM-23 TaxID=2781026 RepID=UPI001F18A7EB|nr:hypothetical protein [Maribellus sp. CM-23]MCE4565099.1 hypothetical protein [Maribellus sp. CM-23]